MELKKFNVTVFRFDPKKGIDDPAGETFVLPVDSPDEEHGISAAMSNCVAFTSKYPSGELRPVAFTCLAVTTR